LWLKKVKTHILDPQTTDQINNNILHIPNLPTNRLATMGCGSSKNTGGEGTEMARPAQTGQTTGGAAPQNHGAPQGHAPTSGATEKVPRNPNNPIVYFDIAIGGMHVEMLSM
jgi:hypothetical protein